MSWLDKETFLWHPYYSDILVSESGTIISYKSGTPRFLAAGINNAGYDRVGIGHANPQYVHVLVAETFVGLRPEGMTVNHKDGSKKNNHFTNLEWVTHAENNRHAWSLGLKTPLPGRPVQIVETGKVYLSISDCARAISGIAANISKCLIGERSTHRGYHFQYYLGAIDEC